MQSINNQKFFFFIKLNFLSTCILGDSHWEPLFKIIRTVKNFRKQKVEKSPKLSKIVLEWSTCQQKSMVALILLSQDTGELTLGIFHFMSLINNDVFPIPLIQPKSIFKNEIISCKTNIPFCGFHNTMDFVSCGRVASINNFTDWRCPFLKFIDPVGHCRERYHN